MVYRIQKTIINKFLNLVDRSKVTETEIADFISQVNGLYKGNTLLSADIFRQKIELITKILESHLEAVRRKRTSKEIKIELGRDLYQILNNDLEDVDYSKTSLSDLDKMEKEVGISISFQNVRSALENLVIGKRRLASESDLEKFLSDQLSLIFGKEQVHRQYSVGGFLALKADIDVGNGQVGIELKIADKLGATDMQRIIGQVIYYKKRFYNSNLIILIASKSSISSTIKELKDFIEELGVTVVFVTAINI